MPDGLANFAVSTVATAPSPATSGTSLVVAAGEGARFPNPATANFNCVIAPVDAQATPTNAEIVRVTAKSTDTLTITRAQEGTSARTVVVGDRFYLAPTKKLFDDIESSKQPLDSDLTALAALTTTSYGRSLLEGADAAAVRTLLASYSSAQVDTLLGIYSTALNAMAGAYKPLLIQPGVQRVSAAGTLALSAINVGAAPPAFTTNTTANSIFQVVPILASEMAISGRTTKLMTKLTVATNTTAPGISFSCVLRPLASQGGNDVQAFTFSGATVTGSTATVTTPALSTVTTESSGAYTVPADGAYALIYSSTGTMATNARCQIHGSLWVAHV